MDNINIFIGWDSREPVAADVCQYSIEQNTSSPTRITMLKQEVLREQLLYARPVDDRGSTEFTFTRFLVPRMMDYKGWAIFCDCDFLWLGDVQDLIEQADEKYAVMLVKHDYRPHNTVKMDGKRQEYYPRKNWSSMVLFNCAHPKNKWLTPYHINKATGQELHRFSWLDDKDIGSLSPEWNWLVGWYHQPYDGVPKALHYTEGGPWFENYRDCDYADIWLEYEQSLKDTYVNHRTLGIDDLHLPPRYKHLLKQVQRYIEDPTGAYDTKVTMADLVDLLKQTSTGQIIGISDQEDLTKKMIEKGSKFDGVVHAFVQGAVGCMGPWNHAEDLKAPIALRSIAKKKIMRECLDKGRDFYYIDTGYFGNGKVKDYHRVTKNAMQWLGPTEDRPADRLERTRVRPKAMTPGGRILLCPPSAKALSYWDLDEAKWVDDTVQEIRKFTDREIIIRLKQPRSVRATVDTIEQALADDIHCMVTFNSIAAVESLIYGKPVFTMGPNAAGPLANTDLSKIEDPFRPDIEQVYALLRCLAYHQFTVEEMRSGHAWDIINNVT